MKTLLLLFISIFSSNCLSQSKYDSIEIYNDSEIYLNMLTTLCKHVVEFYPEKKEVYLTKTTITTDNLPDTLLGLKIIVAESKELRKILKKKKEIMLHRLVPIRYKNNQLYTTLVNFKATCKRKNILMMNQGALTVELVQSNGKLYYLD